MNPRKQAGATPSLDAESINEQLSELAEYSCGRCWFLEGGDWTRLVRHLRAPGDALPPGAVASIDLGSAAYHGRGSAAPAYDFGYDYPPTPPLTLTGPLSAAEVVLAIGDAVRRDAYRNVFMADFVEREAAAVPAYARYKSSRGRRAAGDTVPVLSFTPAPDPTAGMCTADVVALAALGPAGYLEGRPMHRGADGGLPDAADGGRGADFVGLFHVSGNTFTPEWSR